MNSQQVEQLLRAQTRPKAPADLAARLHQRLASEPAPRRPWHAGIGKLLLGISWPSLGAGGVVAVALTLIVMRATRPAVGIQVASVPVNQNVGLQIAFDVGRNVQDVTFDIKLSDGLKFVDAKGQPVSTQEVRWTGELMQGKTVVPVTVRGVRPG
ncbi:MAG: hypothetical protein KGR26_09875, partial [Cyanobacteria bacterium REEB65]|nr:hypothetical protein [Cyanobacteria bacterium REEB65]